MIMLCDSLPLSMGPPAQRMGTCLKVGHGETTYSPMITMAHHVDMHASLEHEQVPTYRMITNLVMEHKKSEWTLRLVMETYFAHPTKIIE